MKFFKYHALGNDYLVIDPKDCPAPPTAPQIKVICHRNFGVGSDGILLGPLPSDQARFALRVFNPDGSEAEKSGNGLRIFSRYLWDRQLVKDEEFAIQTQGGVVKSRALDSGKTVRVEMGQISFWSDKIPVAGPRREVINEKITVGGRTFRSPRPGAVRRFRRPDIRLRAGPLRCAPQTGAPDGRSRNRIH